MTCFFSTAWPCAAPVSEIVSAKMASAAWACFIASSRRRHASHLIHRLIRPEESRGKAPGCDLWARFGRRRPPAQEPPLDPRADKVHSDHARTQHAQPDHNARDPAHTFGRP